MIRALEPEMLAPVERLVGFMARREPLDGVFTDEVTIVENFPPFLFDGPGAAARWQDGFEAHARRSGLEQLQARFGPEQDFSRDGDVVYVASPTTWTGLSHGAPFSEDGGWGFVLALQDGAWRIRAYGWAVTSRPGRG